MPEPKGIVFVVDDDVSVRESLDGYIRQSGWKVEAIPSAQEFLSHPHEDPPSCLVRDVRLPGMATYPLR